MSSERPTRRRLAAMLERDVVGKWGYVAERGACVRRDAFRRQLIVEFDSRQREYYGRDLIQVFLLIADDRCQKFSKTYGPVGLWLDVHRAIHHREYGVDERRWYEPDPTGGLPAELVADLERHGEVLLNWPSDVAEMVDLLGESDGHPVRVGLSVGQFSGDYEARLLLALILARWSKHPTITEKAMRRIREAATIPEGLRSLRLWTGEFTKINCVDVSGVLDSTAAPPSSIEPGEH
jgi:hypothetical protein